MNELAIVWGLMVSLLQMNAQLSELSKPNVVYQAPLPHIKVTYDSLWPDRLEVGSVVGDYIYFPYDRYNPCRYRNFTPIIELD